MRVQTALRWLSRSSVFTSRALAWTLLVALLVCASVVLTLRYWLLPDIDRYRGDIAAALSRASNLQITIGHIAGDWSGIQPRLQLSDVTLAARDGGRAFALARVDATLGWRSLLTFQPHFATLDIQRPSLDVRRDPGGTIHVAGIPLSDEGNGGLRDWLLTQSHVAVHGAAIRWTDEMRDAPPLQFQGVHLQIVNRGARHRFGMRAQLPADLSGGVDVRGDLRGSDWSTARGRLFVHLDGVDLQRWTPWIDLPGELREGRGALRAWINVNDGAPAEIVSDLHLADVRARLREDLPELELGRIVGRLGWKTLPGGWEISGARLALDDGAKAWGPADLRLRRTGAGTADEQGELTAHAFALDPLSELAGRLPLSEALQEQIAVLEPRGTLNEVTLRWWGNPSAPRHYSLRGRFAKLALLAGDGRPGFSGVSGHIDGTEAGGTVQLTGEAATLELDGLLLEPIALASLNAQATWTQNERGIEVKLGNAVFANADAAGTLFGTWKRADSGLGEVDLTGSLTRADARAVPRYLPLTISPVARSWFERALIAGHSKDVKLRLKGRLDDFPFPQDARGLFQVSAQISGGTLDYAERWPRFEAIEGDLHFRGAGMSFVAKSGTASGIRLSNVKGGIADLRAHPRHLAVSGEADGATADFLAFIAKSPVHEMTERFTEGVGAQGSGRLALKLDLPLGQLSGSTVAGGYQLKDNQLVFDRDLPPLEAANGRIEFTESAVRTAGVTGIFMGGPITIAGTTTREGALRVDLSGRINPDGLRKADGPAWLHHLKGAANWRGALTLRREVSEFVVESNLQGVSSSLPAPFNKALGQTLPLRIERRPVSGQSERISLVLGDIARAELVRRMDGRQAQIERGVVRFGGGDAGEPDRPGLWLRGSLKRVDVDEWLGFGREAHNATEWPIAGADLKLGQVHLLGRTFHDLALTVAPGREAAQIGLLGREIEGIASWRGEGKGRLTARLKRLSLAPVENRTGAPTRSREPEKGRELPALDVVVEQFHHGDKQLGRLEVAALHQGRDWRIERLRLVNGDSTIAADGLWQSWQSQPRTQLNVRMDVNDIGRTLTRWNYPPGVRRGTAKIEGQLSWSGSPAQFDHSSLGGHLVVEASNGQFVKLEPGFGKLLGILSLQALPRRITLDFRDIFSDGFAFDTIIGALRIERGVASTENFRLQGPSGRVVMAGQVDLARETQKLRVRVIPALSDGVSIAGALIGGPLAGVATFIAQKILRDPLEQWIGFDYDVTGSWSEPVVARPSPPVTSASPSTENIP